MAVVHVPAALLQLVAHVEHQQRRQVELEHGFDQHELALEARRIDDEHERIGGADALDPSFQYVACDPLVERAC